MKGQILIGDQIIDANDIKWEVDPHDSSRAIATLKYTSTQPIHTISMTIRSDTEFRIVLWLNPDPRPMDITL